MAHRSAIPQVEKTLLKDLLFNEAKVTKLAQELALAYPAFDVEGFTRQVVDEFPKLELKARIGWIAECLRNNLPEDVQDTIRIIISALPAPNDPSLTDNDFGDFIYAPYGEFLARYACSAEELELSLGALYEITKRFSAEDAIRYFINAFPDELFEQIKKWTKDENYHVRRLCSEGTRPKLPWSQKINVDYHRTVPILDNLFYDKTRYVTRSVANHLNDISKLDPDLTISTLKRWRKTGKQSDKEMDYITRHALRGLIKSGSEQALRFVGIDISNTVELLSCGVSETVILGESINISLTIRAGADTQTVVDYIILFPDSKGRLTNKKVYKFKHLALKAGIEAKINKHHSLRANMTTRKITAGTHGLHVQINGKIVAKHRFEVVDNKK
jgi:3-methyladenine DNA glycosylase AlkC